MGLPSENLTADFGRVYWRKNNKWHLVFSYQFLSCLVGEEHEGYTGPPLTLPPNTPPTQPPTTPDGWAIRVLEPGLTDKESK